MSLFSQSLCIGENTLQEIEKGVAGLQPAKVTTPNRSYAINNSDSDVIEESPTNFSTVHSLRERTKSRTKKKKTKSLTCEQLRISKVGTTSNTLSQFLQSKYDFSSDILKILPETVNDVDDGKNCENANVPESTPTIPNVLQSYESDMFDEVIADSTKSSAKMVVNQPKEFSINIAWGDSFDFEDVNLNVCESSKENNEMELNLKVDEHIALGLDNVTFTQNFLNEASFENDLNLKSGSNIVATSKFIEEEMESCKKSFHEYIKEERHEQTMAPNSQLSVSNLNISQSSFVLNYSQSTVEAEEMELIPTQKSKPQPLQQSNSISSWGKIIFIDILNVSQHL